jgi:UPF0755 protein
MRVLRVLAALVVLAIAGLAWLLSTPYRGFNTEAFVDIPRGTGSLALSRLLADAGVIRYRWQFLAVRAMKPGAKLQAGEYLFLREATPWAVFDRLARGDVFFYQLTVPEGQNMFEIAASLDRLGVIGGAQFLEAARDPSPLKDIAPEAPSLEGFLFPDTYRIAKYATAGDLCLQMTGRFRRAWAELQSKESPLAAVTLASLIEKETALAEERPVIASVFHNRLKAGMSLDCDPTAVYAALLEGRYRGEIYRSDLDSTNPYNTYQHAGLPPGPIANPGIEAMKAALHPAETKYRYFVARADGSGGHVFSDKLDAHQRAVSQYRRETRKANQAKAAGPVSRGPAAGAVR